MYKNNLKIIGRNIKAERVRKNYSQEELAELANTTRRSISMIESGLQNPKLTLVIDIANSLNIDLNKFFE